jgi:hypothetical protein
MTRPSSSLPSGNAGTLPPNHLAQVEINNPHHSTPTRQPKDAT